jgi:DNA repair ATPase RecN
MPVITRSQATSIQSQPDELRKSRYQKLEQAENTYKGLEEVLKLLPENTKINQDLKQAQEKLQEKLQRYQKLKEVEDTYKRLEEVLKLLPENKNNNQGLKKLQESLKQAQEKLQEKLQR